MNGSYTPSFMPATVGQDWGNPTTIAGPGGPTGPAAWDTMQGALGGQYKDASGAVLGQQGWVSPVLGAGSALVNAFMGMKQYGLYKDQLAESKRQFGLNYDAQRTTTNTALQDRQIARVASNPGAYESVGAYMQSNGIKGG